MRRWIVCVVAVAAVVRPAGLVADQSPPPPSTDDGIRRIDQRLQQYVDDGQIAGAVALVLRDGRPVYERAFGWSDREAGRRMTPDTIFRIASQTKAITSVAILQLMEQGQLGLSDPVSRFIPAFARTTVSVRHGSTLEVVQAHRRITIRDLLTHTAGISYGVQPDIRSLYEAKGLGPAAGLGWYTADKDEPICTTMERLASLPFVAQPGEAWVDDGHALLSPAGPA
jgi:CubicO group peptidase (beta-lactamase class C family)